jgi:hypothetical protein
VLYEASRNLTARPAARTAEGTEDTADLALPRGPPARHPTRRNALLLAAAILPRRRRPLRGGVASCSVPVGIRASGPPPLRSRRLLPRYGGASCPAGVAALLAARVVRRRRRRSGPPGSTKSRFLERE